MFDDKDFQRINRARHIAEIRSVIEMLEGILPQEFHKHLTSAKILLEGSAHAALSQDRQNRKAIEKNNKE